MEIERKGGKVYLCQPNAEPVELVRVWAGLSWPGEAPGYYICGGQARGGRLYLLAERQEMDWAGLVRGLLDLRKVAGLKMIWHEGGLLGQSFVDRCYGLDDTAALAGLGVNGEPDALSFSQAPYVELPGFSAGVARDWVMAKRIAVGMGLEVFSSELIRLKSLPPKEVMANLADLPVYRAFVMLVCALDNTPMDQPGRVTTSHKAADERTGI